MKTIARRRFRCQWLMLMLAALAWPAFTSTLWAQFAVPVRGVVRTAAGAPLAGAIVSVSNPARSVETGADGRFQIDLGTGSYTLRITHAGYLDATQPVEVATSAVSVDIVLSPLARFSESVTVSAVRAPEDAPVSKTDLPRAEIEARSWGQEIPFLLEQVPSLTQYADSGAPVGYSYIYLRGIPQTRMNVTIDGMPINEPEDSAFYFSNFGDFANAVDSIQVQRGVGTSTVGAPSFVGSINFASAAFTDRPEAVVRTGIGSFGTERLSGVFNSGKVGQGFKFYAQAATQTSDGFKYHSDVGETSIYLGTSHETPDSYLKIFGFYGREHTQLAYVAADETQLAADLRTNPMSPEERDNFGQGFVTAQYHRLLNPATDLAVQGFVNAADGWYRVADEAAAPSGLYQYGLSWHNVGVSTTLRRTGKHLDVTWGSYFSTFESQHTRDVVDGASDYVNHGYKQEFNTFAKITWTEGRWHSLGDVQVRWARFRYAGSIDLGPIDWTFFNPKGGVTFDASRNVSLYASIGRAGREPGRSDMLQGEDNASVPYDLAAVQPEQVVNGEFGVLFTGRGVSARINGYVMSFHHEIAQTGQLSEIGLPLHQNVDRSYRTGVEMDLRWHPIESLQLRHTATYSRNRISTWTQFFDVYDAEDNWTGSTSRTFKDVEPYNTPAVLASLSADYTPTSGATFDATVKYVGMSFLDNTFNPYFTAPAFTDLDMSASLDLSRPLRILTRAHPRLRLQVNNVLDNHRMFPNGYSYQYFTSATDTSPLTLEGTRYYYPLATRNVYVGLELRF
jgi:iron complex outermembrane receptor protein